MSNPLSTPSNGTTPICAKCGLCPGTEIWVGEGGTLAYVHGIYTPHWCLICVTTEQLLHAQKVAATVPELQKKLQTLTGDTSPIAKALGVVDPALTTFVENELREWINTTLIPKLNVKTGVTPCKHLTQSAAGVSGESGTPCTKCGTVVRCCNLKPGEKTCQLHNLHCGYPNCLKPV